MAELPSSGRKWVGYHLRYLVKKCTGESIGGNVNAVSHVLFPSQNPSSAPTAADFAAQCRRNAEAAARSYANRHCCGTIVEEVWTEQTVCKGSVSSNPRRPSPTELARARLVKVGARRSREVARFQGEPRPPQTRVWFEVQTSSGKVVERFFPRVLSNSLYRTDGGVERKLVRFTYEGAPSVAQTKAIQAARSEALSFAKRLQGRSCGAHRVVRREATTSGCG